MAYSSVRAITIDHTKVPNTDLSNFPVLITGTYAWLATVANGGGVTSSSGFDIVFAADAGGSTLLDYERVSYAPTTGVVEFWVRVPTVSHTTDTTIYILYGDASVTTDQSAATAVWDSNFKSVHHYADGTTLSVADSTTSARSVSSNTGVAGAGRIDGGLVASLSGGQDVEYSDTGLPTGAAARTIEVWAKPASFGVGCMWFFGTSGTSGAACGLRFTSSGSNLQVVGWSADADLAGSYSTGTWYHFVVVYNGSAITIYKDGAVTAINGLARTWNTLAGGLFRAGSSWDGTCFDGVIDELRVSNVVRSADWIAASYNNQSNPSTFYTIVSDGILLGISGIASGEAFGSGGIVASNLLLGDAGISSSEAFGTGGSIGVVAQELTGVSGIASLEAFGTDGTIEVSRFILTGYTGIASTAAIGATGAFLPATTRPYTVFIGGVDRTMYIKDPSLSGGAQLGSRASCSFTVVPYMVGSSVQSSFTPDLFDSVLIYERTSGRLFGGEIEAIARTVAPGPSGYFELAVRCTDFGVLCERRVVAKWYTAFLGSYIPIIARDIVDRFLIGTGITYDGHLLSPSYVGEDVLFNYVTVAEAFRQMADATGTDWYIDPNKALRLVSRSPGAAPAAPFSIAQNDGNWRSLTSTRTRTGFWNRVIVRNSQDVGALWTDTAEADGSTLYYTTYPQESAPVVLVDGVEQVVCAITDVASTPGWQWYYIPHTPGVSHNQSLSAPVAGTIEIIYPARTSAVAVAEDADSIAAVGLYERIEEVKDLPEGTTLEQYAAGVLLRGKTISTEITLETDRAGLQPGQALTVAANGVTGTFVIDSVTWNEFTHSKLRFTVRASDGLQRSGSGAKFFSRLVSDARQPVDRVDSHIAFALAETVEGATNPGLTTGVKPATRVARKTGWAKTCRLYFGSVATTPTTSDIEIDVLQNGVSIFGSTKMRFPAGADAVQLKFYFATNPLRINAGDVFTIEVLSADPLAKDGWIELQVQG